MVYRILVFLLLSSPSLCTTTTVSITDVGGVGDGVTSNTAAFVRAVAKLEAKGGGILLVASSTPSPSTFLPGPFNLSSHITLLVEGGATILGSVNIAEWPLMPPMPSYGQGRDHPGPRRVSLIHGKCLPAKINARTPPRILTARFEPFSAVRYGSMQMHVQFECRSGI